MADHPIYDRTESTTGNDPDRVVVSAALSTGGNVRVGPGDNFYTPDDEIAESNADLVAAAVEMTEQVGRMSAMPDEARAILGVN